MLSRMDKLTQKNPSLTLGYFMCIGVVPYYDSTPITPVILLCHLQ